MTSTSTATTTVPIAQDEKLEKFSGPNFKRLQQNAILSQNLESGLVS